MHCTGGGGRATGEPRVSGGQGVSVKYTGTTHTPSPNRIFIFGFR